MRYVSELPSPTQLKEEIPLKKEEAELKQKRDKEIADIVTGNDSRIFVIVGPCSADNCEPVKEYVSRLSKLQEELDDKMLLIPRVYTGKPRTNGKGYKGILHQPDLSKEPNLSEGIKQLRKLHRNVLEKGLTAADEMLYPENAVYLDDMLSYHAVGARSSENQKHRLVASGLDVPVGMKNPTSGDLGVMMNSLVASREPHSFAYRGWHVETEGNPLSHVILRGEVNKYGRNFPNYHYEDIKRVADDYKEHGLSNPCIVIDCNHSNSAKDYRQQPRIAMEVLHNKKHHEEVGHAIKGLMIESYLLEGNQKVNGGEYEKGRSITDPCLGWEDTEMLLKKIADYI